jgi:hypothetical protein
MGLLSQTRKCSDFETRFIVWQEIKKRCGLGVIAYDNVAYSKLLEYPKEDLKQCQRDERPK